jgi:endonuclease/exonuclease/phosphatase family metal-dependent hydrolase
MQIARWQLSSGTNFFAAGIHAIDRRSYPVAEVRGAYAALTRHALDEQWVDGAPLLVLGDLNAWPDLPEVSDRACFFGVPFSYVHRASNDHFFGRKSPPLFRVEPVGLARGTYFDRNTSNWRDIDHVYVSSALYAGATARRLDQIGQKSLLTRQGRPSASRFSDHLPVEARIALV